MNICVPWILGSLAFSSVIGDDVSDFLDNKKQLKPRQYEGNVTDEWDIVINRDPKPFKLSSNLDEEEIGEMSLGLPVSQDVVFSKRRSVEDNILLRNDVDEVSEVLEPGNVSPTYSKVESSAGAQVVYLLVVYALISVLISAIVLVGFVVVRSIRHTREKRAAGLPTAAGTGTAVQGREGEETVPPEEQPGPSNVAIEIDSPTSTETDNSDDSKSSSSSSGVYQTVTVLGETQL